jgi:hypothetical protein
MMKKPTARSARNVATQNRTSVRKDQASSLPRGLEAIAAGRDFVQTKEFAQATNRASQTIRKNYCVNGECFGIRPIKFGNRLLWPVDRIAALLNGEIPSQVA